MNLQTPIPKLPWNIYWINLDRREDRKKHMENILSKNINYRISAIDYKNNFEPYKFISRYNMRGPQYACTLSHIKALETYLNNEDDKNPYCFISEDDCYSDYCQYWQERHFDLFKETTNLDILQMCTTSDHYNDCKLNIQNMSSSCTAFYMIKRNIAKDIINTYVEKKYLINFNNSEHIPITDNIIWKFGDTKLIPMISLSTIDVNFSDISPNVNMYENIYWENYFKNSINKYLNYWKKLEN